MLENSLITILFLLEYSGLAFFYAVGLRTSTMNLYIRGSFTHRLRTDLIGVFNFLSVYILF